MIVGIDATNIRAGGGVTHLKELLAHLNPEKHQIKKIILWGGRNLELFPENKWIEKRRIKLKKEWFICLIYWRYFVLSKKVKNDCQILFNPGGSGLYDKVPYITMSQNMLPFEEKERKRFPLFQQLRYILLLLFQKLSFSRASGILFISNYAAKSIRSRYRSVAKKPFTVAYHGVNSRFKCEPRVQMPIAEYNDKKPFRILYVSIINYYKHQDKLIEAVKILKENGMPIELHLVGGANKSELANLSNQLKKSEHFVKYWGYQNYENIQQHYQKANMFVFSSTCENMPSILVEAMSAGLPILSSHYGPMPEILKDAGDYMDPTNIDSIYNGLKKLILCPKRREEIAKKANMYSQSYLWGKTANETFDFIQKVYNEEVKNVI